MTNIYKEEKTWRKKREIGIYVSFTTPASIITFIRYAARICIQIKQNIVKDASSCRLHSQMYQGDNRIRCIKVTREYETRDK